jgi:hypothetical protein
MVIYGAVGLRVKVKIESWYRLRSPLVYIAFLSRSKYFLKSNLLSMT